VEANKDILEEESYKVSISWLTFFALVYVDC
jgi:hypothetical protein